MFSASPLPHTRDLHALLLLLVLLGVLVTAAERPPCAVPITAVESAVLLLFVMPCVAVAVAEVEATGFACACAVLLLGVSCFLLLPQNTRGQPCAPIAVGPAVLLLLIMPCVAVAEAKATGIACTCAVLLGVTCFRLLPQNTRGLVLGKVVGAAAVAAGVSDGACVGF